MIRIVDNKKMDLTDSEFELYQSICKSYTTSTFNGQDLFKGLFETDDNGIIIFLKPSDKPKASMEVFLFLISIMVHQHLRLSTQQFDALMEETRRVVDDAKQIVAEVKAIQASKPIRKKVD